MKHKERGGRPAPYVRAAAAHLKAWNTWVPSGQREGSSSEGMLTNSVPYGSCVGACVCGGAAAR